MENPLSSRLRPRGCRPQTAIVPSHVNDESASSSTQEARSRSSPTSESLDSSSPTTSASSSRPTRSSAATSSSSSSLSSSTLDSRLSRRVHPYQRQTRSSAQLSQPPSDPVPADQVPATPSPSPNTTSRRAARRSLDAASQQRLFLRRNLISSPRIGGDEIAAAAAAPAPTSGGDSTTSQNQRRNRGGGGSGVRGRGGGGSSGGGNARSNGGGGRIDSLRDRFHSTEARSRSSSASSIIRARLTARISFGQRLALSPSSPVTASGGSNGVAVSNNAAANNGVQAGSDRMTRNGARRAAEAVVDQRVSGIPGLVDIEGVSSGVGRQENDAGGAPLTSRADRMGVLSGPGWSGTLDRTHGDEITVQIIDFGRIMGIPPYEIQLLNNLQGQFQDMLHRSFHHSITSRAFEEIPQRVVVEEDLRPEGGGDGNAEPEGSSRRKEESGESSSPPSSSSPSPSPTSVNASRDDELVNSENRPGNNVTRTTAAASSAAAESRNCTICLMTPVVNDVLKTLPCEHFFHSDCLKQWFTDHASCPMCRDCALCRISGAFNVQFSPS